MAKLSERTQIPPLAISIVVSVLLVVSICTFADRIDCSSSGHLNMSTKKQAVPVKKSNAESTATSPQAPREGVTPEAHEANREQVKLLFDYTKFHIGVYFTLATLILSVLGSEVAKKRQLWLWSFGVAVVALVVAGVAGGVIASSLPHLFGSSDIQYEKIGPLNSRGWCLVTWTYLEHMAFWSAVAFAVIAFMPAMLGRNKQTAPDPLYVVLVRSSSLPPEVVESARVTDLHAQK